MFPPCQPTLSKACLLLLLLSLVRSAHTYMVQPPAVAFHSPPHCLRCSRLLGIMVRPSAALQTPGRTCRVKGVFIPVQEEYLTPRTCAFLHLCEGFCAQHMGSHPLEESCGGVPCITQEQTETD